MIYVDFDLPGPGRIPWDANPYNKGNVWLAFAWTANRIANLNPETGNIQEWSVPPASRPRRALHVHSVIEAPDGMVWFVEDTQCKLSKFDPETQKFTDYEPPSCKQTGSGPEKTRRRSREHPDGSLRESMGERRQSVALDPKTEKFTEFPEGGHAYSLELDKKRATSGSRNSRRGRSGRWTS